MPTLSSGIHIALQAVLAHAQNIEVIEHNVANANTVGYRRQSAVLTTSTPTSVYGIDRGLGAGQRGTGVMVDSIQRFNLQFFDGRYRSVSAEQKNWEQQSEVLLQLEGTLAETGADGLIGKMDQFWSSWQLLAADPTNLSLRADVINSASALAQGLNRRATQMVQIRTDVDQMVASRVGEINEIASKIAELNGEIAHVYSVGEQPNDLLDQRDMLLDRLAEISGAVSFPQQNGEVVVSIGGHMLVTGHDAMKLSTVTYPANSNLSRIIWSDGGAAFTPPSGELKGLLNVRDTVIPQEQIVLDNIAKTLHDTVNTEHAKGYDLNNVLRNGDGDAFFTYNSAVPPTQNYALYIQVNSAMTADKVAVSGALNAPGDNTIAMVLANLKNSALMPGGATLNKYYNNQVTGLGLTIQQAKDNTYQHGLVQKALSTQRESVAGVSLDEEAANLAKAQRAYQAAARVMTVYDEMLNTIINGMGLVGR